MVTQGACGTAHYSAHGQGAELNTEGLGSHNSLGGHDPLGPKPLPRGSTPYTLSSSQQATWEPTSNTEAFTLTQTMTVPRECCCPDQGTFKSTRCVNQVRTTGVTVARDALSTTDLAHPTHLQPPRPQSQSLHPPNHHLQSLLSTQHPSLFSSHYLLMHLAASALAFLLRYPGSPDSARSLLCAPVAAPATLWMPPFNLDELGGNRAHTLSPTIQGLTAGSGTWYTQSSTQRMAANPPSPPF